MKLTKDQRHTAYILLLEASYGQRIFRTAGICWAFSLLTGDNCLYGDFKSTLPELYKKSNYKGGWYMWDSWEERRAALEECISETGNF